MLATTPELDKSLREMSGKIRRIVLKSRPDGMPTVDNFELVETGLPQLANGELLVRNAFIGLAPSSRIRMSDLGVDRSYDAPTPIGDVIYGQTLGTVIETRNPDYALGEMVVLTASGWQEASISDCSLVTKVDASLAAPTHWLGALGVSGFTAYAGLVDVGHLKPDDKVVVSAASGAVGAMVGQIAKARGCTVIGIAGGERKCAFIRDELGFDDAVDYRKPDFRSSLAQACKGGIDLFFDNVGGEVRVAMLDEMSNFGRIVVCGMISEYNDLPASTGPSWLPILTKRLTVRGILMRDHLHLQEQFLREMGAWIRNGKIKPHEYLVEGFENTPSVFIDMLSGRNLGKTIVRIG